MNKKLNIAIAVAAGLFGSVVMHYVAPPLAFAQDQTAAREIRTESVALVDSSNNVVGVFTPEPVPGAAAASPRRRIVLKDSRGQDIWTPEGNTKLLPLTMR